MTFYEPGEILRRSKIGSKKVTNNPTPIDAILYIEYILSHIIIKEDQKITINEGEYYISKLTRGNYRFLSLEKGDSLDTLFRASRKDTESWEILKYVEGDWIMMLEYAYDKVRTCMGSLDRFITEFPPMGII